MGVYWRKPVDATSGIEGICIFICQRQRTRKRMMRGCFKLCDVEKVRIGRQSDFVARSRVTQILWVRWGMSIFSVSRKGLRAVDLGRGRRCFLGAF